jgi:hypothetical protein
MAEGTRVIERSGAWVTLSRLWTQGRDLVVCGAGRSWRKWLVRIILN